MISTSSFNNAECWKLFRDFLKCSLRLFFHNVMNDKINSSCNRCEWCNMWAKIAVGILSRAGWPDLGLNRCMAIFQEPSLLLVLTTPPALVLTLIFLITSCIYTLYQYIILLLMLKATDGKAWKVHHRSTLTGDTTNILVTCGWSCRIEWEAKR